MHLLKDIWFPSEYLEQQGCEGPNQEAIITVSDKHLKLMSLSQLGNIRFLPPIYVSLQAKKAAGATESDSYVH